MLIITNFYTYNSKAAIKDYLNKYDIEDNIIEQVFSDTEEENAINLNVSKNLKYDLENVKSGYMFCQYTDAMLSFSKNKFDDSDERVETVDCRVIPAEQFKKKYSDDYKENNIAITSYIASKLGVKINDIVSLKGREYVVSDIIQVDGITEINDEKEYEISEFYNKSLLRYCYISSDYVNYFNLNENCRINMCINFLESSFYGYTHNRVMVVSSSSEINLSMGRMPEKAEEVLVSKAYLYASGRSAEEVLNNTFKITDLSKEKKLLNIMNAYEYIGEKVTVVGVGDFDGDIVLSDKVYQTMANDYNQLYGYSSMGVKSTSVNDLVEILRKNGNQIKDPFLEKAYNIEQTRDSVKIYIILALTIVLLINVLFVIVTCRYEIKDNSEKIGILRSLGFSYKSINKIFLIGIIRMIIISIIGSIVMLKVSVYLLNKYTFVVPYRLYNVININWLSTFIALIVITGIGFLVAKLSINETKHMTIINTIGNSKN